MSVETEIRRIVVQELSPARIVDVLVEKGVDHDGDAILRITVVFDTEDDRLDPGKVKGLIRHLREPLMKLREYAFPIFTFMNQEEYRGEAA